MAEIQIVNKGAAISGRGKIDRFSQYLRQGCKRAAVVRDPNTPDYAGEAIASSLSRKGIDCVFYTEIPARASSRDAELLAEFIKKGYIQSVIALGGPRTVNMTRLALASVESSYPIDDILDGTVSPASAAGPVKKQPLNYIEIPSSVRNPLMFSTLAAVSDSRNRAVRIVDTGLVPDAVIKDSSLYEKLHRGAFDSICLEILFTALQSLCSRDRHLFTDSLLSLPLAKLFDALDSGKSVSADTLSDMAFCVDYACSITGPAAGFYIAQTINSLTGIPVSFISAILLPHMAEYYFQSSEEAVSRILRYSGLTPASDGQPADSEDFTDRVRKIIKKKNLPIRLSEAGVRKETLSSAAALAGEYPEKIRPEFNISGEKIAEILKNAF